MSLKKQYNIDELIASSSFKRWVRGEAPEEDREYWDRWVKSDPENRALFKKAQEIITGFAIRPGETRSSGQAWKPIQDRLAGEKNNLSRFHKVRKGFQENRIRWAVRIAATFLLIAVSSYMVTYFYQPPADQTTEVIEQEITTEYGEQKTVRLSDGSEIILNGNTSVTYTIDTGKPGYIDLFLEGEAYFSVSGHDEQTEATFQVRTEEGLVKVLGTRFVVSTYSKQTRVAVEAGSVSVNLLGHSEETVLNPGQLGQLDSENGQVLTDTVNMEIYTSWVNGRLYFENTPMEEVASRLEHTFGVKVIIRDSDLKENRVSGSIESSSLDIITSALSIMLDTPIHKSESEKVIYVGDNGG